MENMPEKQEEPAIEIYECKFVVTEVYNMGMEDMKTDGQLERESKAGRTDAEMQSKEATRSVYKPHNRSLSSGGRREIEGH